MSFVINDQPLAALIPPTRDVQAALAKAEEEAALLRKLLRLAFTRDEEAKRIEADWKTADVPIHTKQAK